MDPHLSRIPTMNIHRSATSIGRHDPLKRLFTNIFDLLPASARGHVVGVIGELIGTIVFFFLAFAGIEVASASSNKEQSGDKVSTATPIHTPAQLLYIALSVGFAVVVTAWTFFRISGGLFNPVISLGMALIGAITWARCALLCIAQTAGTIIAAFMVNALFNGGFHTGTSLGSGTSLAQGILIEMLLTAQLAFTIFMLAAEEHSGTFLAPIGIGLSVFIAHLVGVFWTGASMNPIRSLAPNIVNRSFNPEHWIYWVGPISGVFLAVLLYKLVKALEYESIHDDMTPTALPVVINRRPSSILADTTHSVAASIRSLRQDVPTTQHQPLVPPANSAGEWADERGRRAGQQREKGYVY